MNISTRQLRSYVTVARELHFTRAANLLGISQPALSATIHQLEETVGAPLFDRTGRRVHLTQMGAEFLNSATRLLEDMEQSVASLRDLVEKRTGFVKVAALPSAVYRILAPALGEFHQHYPQIKLTVRDSLNDDILQAVRRGDVDFGIAVPPDDSNELAEIRLLDDQFVIAMHRSHALAKKENIQWSDLRGFPIVHVARGSNVRKEVELQLLAQGIPTAI